MKIVLVSLLVLVALVGLIGWMLPAAKVFEKKEIINAPDEEVFRVVTAVEEQSRWRPDVREIRVLDELTWKEVPKSGTALTFRIKRKIPNRLFEITIVEPANYQGNWLGTFERKGEQQTLVYFRETIILKNPFARIFGHLFINLNPTMDAYMNHLKQYFHDKKSN